MLKITAPNKGFMLRKLIFLIILLLFLPGMVFAQPNGELFDYHALDLELSITNDFDVAPTSSKYYIDYVSAELSWYPREDYRQEVDYITTDPGADFDEEIGFLFEWKQPSRTSFSIEQESEIKAKNEFLRVSKKIDFPIKDLDPAYSIYLEPREIIDINDDIRQIASEIVQGEDDLYRAVFKLADWVENNVEYDLSTLTVEAAQKSSWVLKNKKGVCDEITNLFISMCRSLGIPARFVTGVSYSNINLQNDGWGPHGWAEVYFPNLDWVPVDVTYQEVGYLDATHIKLKTGLDTKETSINYATRGTNTEINPGKLEYDITVTDQDYKLKPLVELEAEAAEEKAGFGSYNLLILSVKNQHSYYVTSRLSLANVKELQMLDDNFKSIILAPREEKKLYWMIRVSPNLKKGYIYEFPLKVIGDRGEEVDISFKSAKDFTVYSEEYIGLFMITEQPEEKLYSKNILVTCSQDKKEIYLDESVNISCVLDNKGDQALRSLRICLDDECSTTRVPGKEAVRFDYTKEFDTLGVKTLVFKAQNELVEKSYYSIIEIQDKPLLEIIDLSFPENISYKDLGEIDFFIRKKSATRPKNVKILLEHELMQEEWSVPSLDRDYKFTVLLRGENLKLNKNDFKVIVTYRDKDGEKYTVEEEFSINLVDVSFFQRVLIWLHIAEYKIENWITGLAIFKRESLKEEERYT